MNHNQPQADAQLTPEQLVEAVYGYAADLMRSGASPATIKQNLMDRGLDEDAAATVVRNLTEARSKAVHEAKREAGKKNMLYGALWCIGGTVVTVGTMMAAKGGGSFVIAWGAIVFGGLQFIWGVCQTVTGSSD
jgi:hypothetical protein